MRSFLPFCLLLLVACQQNQGSDVSSAKMIQGEDDRTQISAANKKLQKTASAIAMIISKDQLVDNKDGTFSVRARDIDRELCPEEKLKDSFRYGICTAFKIGDNEIATAGHCLEEASKVKRFCEEFRLVFNFNDVNTEAGVDFGEVIVKESQVVSCDQIVYYSSLQADDVAILKAKMSPQIPTLAVSKRELKEKDQVVKIGSGHGYLANSSLGTVTKVDHKYKVESTIDIFGGDSGSPLLDAKTHEVVGVTVRAELAHTKNRIFDSFRYCYKEPKTKNETDGTAISMKASNILVPAIKSIENENLVERTLNSPTMANLALIKKEISPDLHFSIFREEEGSFINVLFQRNELSVPLLNEIGSEVPKESYLGLLILGYLAKNNEFTEAVFDKFLSKETEYNLEIAIRMLPILPASRLNNFFEQYEDSELIDMAINLYEQKSPFLKDLLRYRKDLMGISKTKNNKKISVWESMEVSSEALYLERPMMKEFQKLQYDYEIMKTFFDLNEISEQDLERLKGMRTEMSSYLVILHQKLL